LLSRPKLPGIPGIETFKGHSFHTSRWDFNYTGGDTTGGLTKLGDKRIAVIGTGATGVQATPYLAEAAEHLYVFQRTPSIIDIRANEPTRAGWWSRLPSGWQTERMLNFDQVIEGRSAEIDLVADQWSQIWGRPSFEGLSEEQRAQKLEEYDDLQMERIRRRIEESVADPVVAEALKPYYSRFCKRPCFNDEYLETFNRNNVTLVHTDGRGPDEISAHAVHFGGTAYEVDCIVYATGFESFNTTPSQSGRYTIIGRDGISLDEKWGGDTNKFRSLHGIMAHGFPNMFVMGQSRQSATSFNQTHRIRRQTDHVVALIEMVERRNMQSVEPTEGAESSWLNVLESVHSRGDVDAKMRECTPGYYNNEGRLDNHKSVIAAGFGGGTAAFTARLEEWRENSFDADVHLR
jgi:cyclohexanone monooxygenase